MACIESYIVVCTLYVSRTVVIGDSRSNVIVVERVKEKAEEGWKEGGGGQRGLKILSTAPNGRSRAHV